MSRVGDRLGIDYELTVRNIYYEDNGIQLLKCVNSKVGDRLEAVIEFDSDCYDIKYLLDSSVSVRNINKDGIPEIYNIFGDKETTYVSTEFIAGSNLEEYFNEYAMEYSDKISLINIIGEAIAYIHNYQDEILYDKITPQNIIITENSLVYLLEYGFTKYLSRDYLYRISHNSYTAPELKEYYDTTRVMDTRSDVYSFGALIYYIITEKTPNKKTILADDLDVNMKKIVFKCMAEDMDDRYDNIEQVLRDIKKIS